MSDDRRVRWFSCGAASAVATKLDLAEFGPDAGPVVYIDTGSEHPDNPRFMADCSRWFGVPILTLKSEEYEDTWDVWKRKKFILGPLGAPCTTELKKKVRERWQRPTDIHVFGYDARRREVARLARLQQSEPGLTLAVPLIDRGLLKGECFTIIDRAGLRLPVMYEQGYANNNCIGCPKGGMGYWNKIRVDYPLTFLRMAAEERERDFACLSDDDGPVFLDELDPDRGNYTDETMDCSIFCAAAEVEISGASQ
jgi:3'-phosphoadenosine 5'-phosphosulfate sulfotransferase (PAPS reductase)/FAD synthetase